MNITLKSPEELKIMREGGKILAEILETLGEKATAGIETGFLDEEAEKLMKQYNVSASFKGYRGYPKSICTAVNEEIVHAIPGKRILKEGDILTIDCGVYHQGFHTDAAITIPIGTIRPEVAIFLKTTERALYETIDICKPGIHIGDISATIQKIIESKGFSPVHSLTGHGVGKNLHEPPMVPNFGNRGAGPALKPGMTLAIEPIVNMGKQYTQTRSDGWTIVTADGSLSCQFEHTIAITTTGAEILTKK